MASRRVPSLVALEIKAARRARLRCPQHNPIISTVFTPTCNLWATQGAVGPQGTRRAAANSGPYRPGVRLVANPRGPSVIYRAALSRTAADVPSLSRGTAGTAG
jgi:hypothetical protein